MECVIDIPGVFKVRWMDGFACVCTVTCTRLAHSVYIGPGTWHTDICMLAPTAVHVWDAALLCLETSHMGKFLL